MHNIKYIFQKCKIVAWLFRWKHLTFNIICYITGTSTHPMCLPILWNKPGSITLELSQYHHKFIFFALLSLMFVFINVLIYIIFYSSVREEVGHSNKHKLWNQHFSQHGQNWFNEMQHRTKVKWTAQERLKLIPQIISLSLSHSHFLTVSFNLDAIMILCWWWYILYWYLTESWHVV